MKDITFNAARTEKPLSSGRRKQLSREKRENEKAKKVQDLLMKMGKVFNPTGEKE